MVDYDYQLALLLEHHWKLSDLNSQTISDILISPCIMLWAWKWNSCLSRKYLITGVKLCFLLISLRKLIKQWDSKTTYFLPSYIHNLETFYITRALLLIFTSETEMRQSRHLMIICFKLTNTLMTRLTSDVITRSLIII